jgi:uncharacterized membrane protein
MSKNNGNNSTQDDSDDEWEDCPECGRSVKSKNLDKHMIKMHDGPVKNRKNIRKNHKNRNGSSRADQRKDRLKEKRKREDMMVLGFVVIAIIGIIAGYFYLSSMANNDIEGPAPAIKVQSAPDKDEVRIPINDVNDGKAHYYSSEVNGVDVRYFVLKSSDGVYRAAFDACDVCYDAKRGYRQEGDDMVCNNCGQRFASVRINVEKGGCNPAPLDRAVDGNELVIKNKDIETGRFYFK